MLTTFYRTVKKNAPLQQVDGLKVGGWVQAVDPSEVERSILVEQLELDESLLLDALDPYEVPRIEREANATYIFTRYPDKSHKRVVTRPLLIIYTKNYFITVSKDTPAFFDKCLSGKTQVYTTQKTNLLIQLFLAIFQDYQKVVNSLNKEVRNKSYNIERIDNKDITSFVEYESVFNDFLSSLNPTSTALKNLLSGKYLRLYDEDADLIEDLFLSAGQIIEMCRSNLKHIVNVREAYSTILSNNLNKNMRLLTVLTLLFTVPTMVSSFFGMNVPVPWAHSPYAFTGVLLFSLIMTMIIFYPIIKK